MNNKKLIALVLSTAVMFSSFGSVFAAGNLNSKDLKVKSDFNLTKSLKNSKKKHKDTLERIKADKDFEVVSENVNGGFSVTASKNTKKSKEEMRAKLAQFSAQSTSTGTISASNSKNYSDSYVYVGFEDGISCSNGPFQNCIFTWTNGYSTSGWYGEYPYYASSIDQTDTFQANSITGSLAFGYGTGEGTFQNVTNGYTCTYPQLTGDYYEYDHYYDSNYLEAYIITSVTRSSATTYRFGSTTVSTSCKKTFS